MDIYKQYEPDAVLLDINMPKMDGFAVLEELKKVEGTRYVPVLVLTAQRDDQTRLRALGSGARDYLTKPFDITEVRMRIRNLIETRLLYRRLETDVSDMKGLLDHVLPAPVARELQTNGSYAPRRIDDASVMFLDLAGFSAIAEQTEPLRLVEELEVCYTFFDRSIQRHRLEKLKTMGDGYLCAGGILREDPNHPVQCVLAALELQQFMRTRKVEMEASGRPYWGLRVGIHVGPVIAGVIGRTKPMYDIWGGTVNLTKRIEEQGESGWVHVSETVAERLGDLFNIESWGDVSVSSVGTVEVFQVERIGEAYSMDPQGIIPNPAFHDALSSATVHTA